MSQTQMAFVPAHAGSGNTTEARGAELGAVLGGALEHVGRGMLVVGRHGRLLHANRAARAELERDAGVLTLAGGLVQARLARDRGGLEAALAAAFDRGLRRLLLLGRDEARGGVELAVLPLAGAIEGGCAPAVLLSLPRIGRQHDLALLALARLHGLTEAETQVLQALAAGDSVQEIARCKAVAVCTVRTQVQQLRAKLGEGSIRELLNRIAALPPMVGVLQ